MYGLWTNRNNQTESSNDCLVPQQALSCRSTKVSLHSVFPEDLGHPITGPASTWSLREFQLLEGVNDAYRLAGYLCRVAGAEHKRPISVLSTSQKLNLVLSNDSLSYRGPLPLTCGCLRNHTAFHGLSDQGDFISSQYNSLGVRFWTTCLQASLTMGTRLSLWDGAATTQSVPHSLSSVGITPLMSKSVA